MAKNNPFNQGRSLAIKKANEAGTNKGTPKASSTSSEKIAGTNQFHGGGPVTQGSSRGLLTTDFFKIHIGHIPTGEKVAFEGWVTNFSDNYNAQWSEEQVYGRMDPLSTYQGTGRNIQIQFDVPNDSRLHAAQNMINIQKLIQFLYPVYDADAAQRVLLAAPLLTLKWTNLASGLGGNQKLVGYINGGLSYAPDIGEGGFMDSQIVSYGEKSAAGDKKGIRNLFPKKVSLGFSFTVLHTHLVGWTENAASTPKSDPNTEASTGDGGEKVDEKPATKSFTFGGTREIAMGYPYINIQPPMPDAIVASRKEVADKAAADAKAAEEKVASEARAKVEQEEERQRALDLKATEEKAANDAWVANAPEGKTRWIRKDGLRSEGNWQ